MANDAQPPKRPQPPAFGMTHIVPLDNFPDHFDTQGRVLPHKQDDLLAKLFGLTGDPVLNAATAPGTGGISTARPICGCRPTRPTTSARRCPIPRGRISTA
ncbi:MAG: hypothetical protein R2857_09550 [Vampirovibrionales bacterium]